ncbi:MAG: hypothetical protein E8D41_14910 [Nitrospira sp.]|nr:MAG: hypothetical protein E8D41_14910 [Nitrospira sp.]
MTENWFGKIEGCLLLLATMMCWLGVLSAGPSSDRLDEEQVVRMYRDVVPATVFLASSYTTGNGRSSMRPIKGVGSLFSTGVSRIR